MKRRGWIIVGVIVAVAAGIFVWRWLNPPPQVDPWQTTVLERGNLTDIITANGIINPVRVVNVGTQVSGIVESLNADFNDRVTAGEVLLRIDPALFTSRLAASEAGLANARANAALQAANAARAATLVKQDYISRQDYETTLASSRSTAALVKQAEAQIRQDKANLDFTIIRSPVSGIVIARLVDIGQTVAASFNTPVLFQIARDLTQMQIEASVAEADIARVQPGMAVDFTVDAYGLRSFGGSVAQIRLNPTTQQNVVTYTVIVTAPNPDGALLPGMTANASFVVSQKKNVLLVPNAALSFKPEGYKPPRGTGRNAPDMVTVFARIAGQPQARRIKLGASDAEFTEVISGDLKPGDSIITGTNVDVKKSGGLFSGPPGGRRESANGGRGDDKAGTKPPPERADSEK
jgi:HlyD family secretion protein